MISSSKYYNKRSKSKSITWWGCTLELMSLLLEPKSNNTNWITKIIWTLSSMITAKWTINRAKEKESRICWLILSKRILRWETRLPGSFWIPPLVCSLTLIPCYRAIARVTASRSWMTSPTWLPISLLALEGVLTSRSAIATFNRLATKNLFLFWIRNHLVPWMVPIDTCWGTSIKARRGNWTTPKMEEPKNSTLTTT